jgi:protein O-GlcNAc transferase
MLDWLNRRLDHLRGKVGEVPESESALQAVVPEGPLALYAAGRTEEAAKAAADRLADQESDPEALKVLALLALDREQPKAAQPLAQKLVDMHPQEADGWVLLGRVHAGAGRKPAAQAAWERARAIDPEHPGLLVELALAALAARKPQEAADLIARVRRADRRLAVAHAELADALRPTQPAAAAQHYRAAIAADPRHAGAHANLGALLNDQGRGSEAAPLLERALELVPTLAPPAFNLAMLRIGQRDWHGAGELLDRYLAATPNDADAHYWRGNAWMGQGDAAAARRSYASAVRLQSSHAKARWGLAMAQLPAIASSEQEQSQALANFARELEAMQKWCRNRDAAATAPVVGAQQPFYIAYVEQNHAMLLRQYGTLCASLMAGWAKQVGVPPPAAKHAGKLKVGIVSAHIHSHSVWHALVRGWVEHLDRGRFELHLFHTGASKDAETAWAGRHAPVHHGLGEWTSWAKAISDLRFDALVYPEIGMDATTARLAALRLARVQVAGWGHPVTSGLPTMDAYLSAAAFEPDGAQAHYTEQLVALPRLGCSYQPYRTAPQGVDLSAWNIAPDDCLLLSPGVAFKYAPQHDSVLVEIARRCPGAKLVLFRQSGDHSIKLEQRLRAAFEAAGVDFDASVRFIPWQSQAAFFGLLQRAHVFLDTLGFSGFNTVMQAVECATPIVAWEGRFMRGRFASAVLRELRLDDWVAATHEDYVAKVVRLLQDLELHARVRGELRERAASLYGDRSSVTALASELERLCAA